MAREITMLVSSRTGNTRKIADAVRDELANHGWSVRVREKGEPIDTECVIICFWCFKSRFDPLNAKLLEGMSGKRILAFGTFGGYPESPYGSKVRRNVTSDVNERNTCLGVFLSQGKVGTHNIEKRRALPHDDPHYLDDAGVARILESGEYERHVNRYRNKARTARDCLMGALHNYGYSREIAFEEYDSGLHFVLSVETTAHAQSIAKHAAKLGVGLAPLEAYDLDGTLEHDGRARFVMQHEGIDDNALEQAARIIHDAITRAERE